MLRQSPITETSYLLTDHITGETNYYFCQWSDNSTASGRRCGLFDKTGAEVLSLEAPYDAALSGGLLAQYQKSCDINVGTGMVTIALASLIIGETLVGKRTMVRRVLGVVFGSCLYRFIVAVALRFNVPAAAMKLVSAIIVAVAISMPAIQEKIAFEKRRSAARQARKERV